MFGGKRRPTIEELVREHHALLYRYAYRLTHSAVDAEDLTQQTYLIAYEKLEQLRNPAAAKSWLCTIFQRTFWEHQKKYPAFSSFEQIHEPLQIEESTAIDLDEERLQNSLDLLPEEYRSAVILFYFQELSYKEIATALDVPIGTVMSRISRGKSLLKELLAQPRTEPLARQLVPASAGNDRLTAISATRSSPGGTP